MQFMSADEKAALERKREELYQLKVDVQDRIRKAAALGDLSENAEYHFAKEENRSVERQIADLESKLKNAAIVSNEDVPENVVFLGHTVKLLDLSDDTEQLVRLVGEAVPSSADSEIMASLGAERTPLPLLSRVLRRKTCCQVVAAGKKSLPTAEST